MSAQERLVSIFHTFLFIICAHFIYRNVGLFDEYLFGGFFDALFSGSLILKFPSFRFPSLKLPSYSLPTLSLTLPTFGWPKFELHYFKLPTFKLPAFKLPVLKLPQIPLSSACLLSFIKSPFSYLINWTIFIVKWIYSSITTWFWFPPIFGIIVGIAYLNVLDVGGTYTMTYHGEHSLVAFELLMETYVTPLVILVLIYNFVNWFITPVWSPFESLLLGWLIRLFLGLLDVYSIITSFLLESFPRIRAAYTRFDIIEARLRVPKDLWEIIETWRHTKLSRFMQRLARWTFDTVGHLVPFYRPGHPKRPVTERDLRLLSIQMRARFTEGRDITARETVDAVRQFREDHSYMP
ncbi:hypothetical protein F4776DRAFT_50572 [Hypoxylon sp. NC0597]|nr:hypothetical protein F4776DRAFT_50572 [Hypoxylon sp. NC0597]